MKESDVRARARLGESMCTRYDGTHIRLRQSKTGAPVVLPVGAPLKAALDAAKKTWAAHSNK